VRPWASDTCPPRVFMWHSSIPETWIKIKGAEAFQHVSQTGANKNTLEFLKSNQKYINLIADPLSKTPSRMESPAASQMSSKVPSRAASPKLQTQLKAVDLYSTGFHSLESPSVQIKYPAIEGEEMKSVAVFTIPEEKKMSGSSPVLRSFHIDIPEKNNEAYLVNQYSLPKLLVGGKKVSSTKEINFRNKTVNTFLKRFEKKDEVVATVIPRKGVNGWKLVDLKKSKKKRNL
jgi:hypothetical protein